MTTDWGFDPTQESDRLAEAALARFRREVEAAQSSRALEAAQERLHAALARARGRTHAASAAIIRDNPTDHRGERPRSTGPTGPNTGESP